MAGVNKVMLIGNLGRDPEIRNMDNGAKKASFSLATSESYQNRDGERITQTEWHNVVLWRGLAEVAEKYLKKGQQVYIEGKLTHRSYMGKDGTTKYITEVIGRDMTLLSNRRDGGTPGAATGPTPTSEPASSPQKEADELPF